VNIPAEKWYQAIKLRRSRRSFLESPLTEEDLTYLRDCCNWLNSFWQGVRVVLVAESPDKVFRGAIGSYGKIKGAPAYVAFIGDRQDPNVQEKLGYLGECFVLEATSLGLATCWVAGFFRPEVVTEQIEMAAKEKVIAVSPLGYADKEFSFTEKLMYRMTPSHKRKDLTNMCSGLAQKEWPSWIKCALEAARLAPSAVNRQPWHFTIEKDSITVSLTNPEYSYHISKRLDCGIAMLHIEIGALYEGIKGNWEYLDNPHVARFKLEK